VSLAPEVIVIHAADVLAVHEHCFGDAFTSTDFLSPDNGTFTVK
jgi:hypothetical protein